MLLLSAVSFLEDNDPSGEGAAVATARSNSTDVASDPKELSIMDQRSAMWRLLECFRVVSRAQMDE